MESALPKSARCDPTKKQRARMVLFIDALINYTSLYSPEYTLQVKGIVRYCILRNREGDRSYFPLSRALIVNVRKCLGEFHWSRLISFYKLYITAKGGQARERKCLQQQQLKPMMSQPQLSLMTALGMHGCPSPSKKAIDTKGAALATPFFQTGSLGLQGW